MIPQWLVNEVADGLSALVALRLENAPGEDVLDKTADIWELAFMRELGRYAVEDLDAVRIRDGFGRCFPQVRRWPAPREVIELMPRRPAVLALAAPPHDPSSVQEEYRVCKPILEELIGKFSLPPRVAAIKPHR